MPVCVIVDIVVHDRETYETYKHLAADPVATYGGQYPVRGG
jgi:uncharacterized protein (DUF1330 family)